MSKPLKTTAEIMIDALLAEDVDTVFGIPGVQIYPIFDAIHNTEGKIKAIAPRHEQGAAYMALGYARSTGKTGVCSIVPGPGVLNAGAALCTAYGVNAPVMCLTGEIPSDFMGHGRGHLHELKNQQDTLQSIVKWAGHISRPEQTSSTMTRAFKELHEGRKGPVSVQSPWDVLPAKTDETNYVHQSFDTVEIDSDAIADAVKLLSESSSPMIMVGGGALEASAEVTRLAELLEVPVVCFRGGQGVVSGDSDLSVCAPAGFKLWQQTDVLIAIGTRMELQLMRWGDMMKRLESAEGKQVIRIDIDPEEFNRVKTDINILGDAPVAVAEMTKGLIAANISGLGDREHILSVKQQVQKDIQEVQPQMDYLDVIRDVLPRDGFFVEELCQIGFTSNFGFPIYEPRTYVTPGYQGTLGFGFPTSLGVKVANPDKTVLSITGDGGFMFGLQELATAVQHNIGVVTLVFNNSVYGNILRDQMNSFDGHAICADMVNPDYVKMAEAFGAAGYRVSSPGELKPVLEKAIAEDKPALIDVIVPKGSEVSPWKYLHPNGLY